MDSPIRAAFRTCLVHDWSAIKLLDPRLGWCAPCDRHFAIDLWLDHCDTYLADHVIPYIIRAGGEHWDNRRRKA